MKTSINLTSSKPYPQFYRIVLYGNAADEYFQLQIPASPLQPNKYVISLENFTISRSNAGGILCLHIPSLTQPNSYCSLTGGPNTLVLVTNSSSTSNTVAEGTCGIQVLDSLLGLNQMHVVLRDNLGNVLTDQNISYVLSLVAHEVPSED